MFYIFEYIGAPFNLGNLPIFLPVRTSLESDFEIFGKANLQFPQMELGSGKPAVKVVKVAGCLKRGYSKMKKTAEFG